MDDFDKAKDVMREARNQIHWGFEYISKDQDALRVYNGVLNVDGLNIITINTRGGVVVIVTRNTLTHIKGTKL